MMICPKCKSEMSKKWQAKSPGERTVSSGMVWSCGVCGGQLTLADLKSYAQTEHKVEHEPASDLLTLPRPVAAVTPWAPRDAKRNGG
jgi:hypothetical protein